MSDKPDHDDADQSEDLDTAENVDTAENAPEPAKPDQDATADKPKKPGKPAKPAKPGKATKPRKTTQTGGAAQTRLKAAVPAIRLVAVVALAAGVVVAGAAADNPTTPARFTAGATGNPTPLGPVLEPLNRAQVSCVGPEARGLDDSSVGEAAMEVTAQAVTAPFDVLPSELEPDAEPGGSDDAGRVSVLRLDPVPAEVDPDVEPIEVQDPGAGEIGEISVTEGQGITVSGEGAGALGLAAAQWHVSEEEFARGLTAAPCVTPGTDLWLVAGGGDAGRLERVVIVNPSADPVTADVTVHGESGVLPSTGGQDVVVAGNGRVVVLLDAIAGGESSPAVHVRSSGGPVVAMLGDRWLDGSIDRGLELTPPAAPADLDQVVPIIAADLVPDAERQRLRVVATGDVGAIVQVRALTSDGPVRIENDVTRVEPGATVDIDVSDVPEGATALEVTSDEPVTAAAVTEIRTPPPEDDAADGADAEPGDADEETESTEPPPEASELGWLPAATPITALAGSPLPHDEDHAIRSTLLLSSLDGATVEVVTVDGDGESTTEQIDVGAAGGADVDLGSARQVWVRPVSGEVYAAVVAITPDTTGGPMVAGLPLAELPVSREVLPLAPSAP